MRISVEINVYGSSMDEIVKAATQEWRTITGNSEDELPEGCEVSIVPSEDLMRGVYNGVVFIRAKMENYGHS
jgi:hypothetical protein